MARGRKKQTLTLEEQLENTKQEIANYTDELKSLKSKRKTIEAKIAEREKDEIYQAFLKSEKSIDDLFKFLNMNEVTNDLDGESETPQ